METPTSVTVLSDGLAAPEASALCGLLGLLGAECHQHDPAEVLDGPAVGGLLEHLRRSALVIALSSDAVSSKRLAHLVHRLRSDTSMYWDGAFLAVIEGHEERSALLKLIHPGDEQNGRPFDRAQGHAAVSRPVNITELLRELAALVEMGPHTWAARLHELDVWRVGAMTREAESLIGAGDTRAAARVLGEVISLAESITWEPLLLDWHRDSEFVQELLQELPSSPLPAPESGAHELTTIVLRVKRILSKTWVGGY